MLHKVFSDQAQSTAKCVASYTLFMTLLCVFQQIKTVKKERKEAAAVGHGQGPCSKKVSSFLSSVYVVEVMFSTSLCVYVWVIILNQMT